MVLYYFNSITHISNIARKSSPSAALHIHPCHKIVQFKTLSNRWEWVPSGRQDWDRVLSSTGSLKVTWDLPRVLRMRSGHRCSWTITCRGQKGTSVMTYKMSSTRSWSHVSVAGMVVFGWFLARAQPVCSVILCLTPLACSRPARSISLPLLLIEEAWCPCKPSLFLLKSLCHDYAYIHVEYICTYRSNNLLRV